MTKTITISQWGIIFTQLHKACHICRWKHQNSVCQQSFHGDRLFSVWQVHRQELFQLAACNSKQFCSCLSGVFLTIHKYTQHTGFPTCARSLLLYDILARSRVIRFPIVFAVLPLRKRRSFHENLGSINTFEVYYNWYCNYYYCCHHKSQVLPKTCRMIKGLVCLFVVSTRLRCVNVQNR